MSKDEPIGLDVISSPETSENQESIQTDVNLSKTSQIGGDESQDLSDLTSESREINEEETSLELSQIQSPEIAGVKVEEDIPGPSRIQENIQVAVQEEERDSSPELQACIFCQNIIRMVARCCCGMGMKLRCFESSGSHNSYLLLENLSENKDSSTEKQEELQFFNDDGSFTAIVVEKNLRAIDLCMLLAVKNRVAKELTWCIVEHWVETGVERVLEDHEDVLAVHRQTESGAKKFIFRRIPKKYDFFADPDYYFPGDMVEFRDEDSDGDEDNETDVIEKFLQDNEDSPSIYSQASVLQSNRITWINFFLLLRDSKILMSSKANVVANYLRHWKKRGKVYKNLSEQEQNKLILESERSQEKLQLLADLNDYEVYSCLNAKNHLKAQTEFGIILRKTSEEDFSSSIAFACESERDRTCWLTAMRLSKYGKQIRENYRSYMEKDVQLRSLAQQYSSAAVPNVSDESIRSRVAMDFTGSVGRIVEDPTEAQAIAVAEGAAWKKKWRLYPQNLARKQSSEMNAHLNQPWYHKGMSREQATAVINAHGTDGVFLVRKSRSNQGCYVLTFKCSGKVIHTPIAPMTDPVRDEVCFTIDNGVTKFYDLLQLIEFYQLNAGCLPLRLTHYLEKNPTSTPRPFVRLD